MRQARVKWIFTHFIVCWQTSHHVIILWEVGAIHLTLVTQQYTGHAWMHRIIVFGRWVIKKKSTRNGSSPPSADSRWWGETKRKRWETSRVMILMRKYHNTCSGICLCRTLRRLSLRRGGHLWCHPLPTPTRGGSSGLIHGNAGKLTGVKQSARHHAIAIRAHALLVVFVLVRAFRANPRRYRCRIMWGVGHHGGLWCNVSLLCICASAHLRMCVVNKPTKPPGKKQKYRRHHPMKIVPQGSFENLCICVQSNKITAQQVSNK